MEENKDLKLKLLAGKSISIGDVCNIYPLKLSDIVGLGDSLYNSYLSVLLMDKTHIDEMNKTDITNFELLWTFCVADESKIFEALVANAIKAFFNEENVNFHSKGFIYLGELDEKRIIDNSNFNQIQDVIRLQNCIAKSEEETYNPANEKAKKIVEMIKKNKQNQPKKRNVNIDLYSIISGVAWKSNNMNIFDIWNLTVYQLYDAFYRLENIEQYNLTMNGIYAGTIDTKNLNLKDLNWAKILKF